MFFKSWLGSNRARGVGALLASALTLLSLALVSACTVTTADNGTAEGTGDLSVNWTIASSADPGQCSAYGAAGIVLQLFDSNNVAVGDAQSSACTDFGATLSNVDPGTYTLTAELVDSNGADVTTTVTVPGIVIDEGAATTQPIDFPTTSFLSSASGTGSIAVSWTIESGTDVASCGTYDAASISLQLYESDGVTPIGAEILEPCTAFSTEITNLTPGAYMLSAQLVNSTANVSTLIPPQPITVTAGTSFPEAFDFPASAF